jgi:hypothetical protein
MTAPEPNSLVDKDEELRRALHELALDPETSRPSSGNFRTEDMSVDVASLASLDETRRRHPRRPIAITKCEWFIDLGHPPRHHPLPDNIAHAIVPGQLTKTEARKIANLIQVVHPPA